MEIDRGNCGVCQYSINLKNCVYYYKCGHFICCDCFKASAISVIMPDGKIKYINKNYEQLFDKNGDNYQLLDAASLDRRKNDISTDKYLSVLDKGPKYRGELIDTIKDTFLNPSTAENIIATYGQYFNYDTLLIKFGFDTNNFNPNPIDLNRILNGFYSLLSRYRSSHVDPLTVLSNFSGYPGQYNPNSILGDYAGACNMIILQSIIKVIGSNRADFVDENASLDDMLFRCGVCRSVVTTISRMLKNDTDTITRTQHRLPDRKPSQLLQTGGTTTNRLFKRSKSDHSYTTKYHKYKLKYLSLLNSNKY